MKLGFVFACLTSATLASHAANFSLKCDLKTLAGPHSVCQVGQVNICQRSYLIDTKSRSVSEIPTPATGDPIPLKVLSWSEDLVKFRRGLRSQGEEGSAEYWELNAVISISRRTGDIFVREEYADNKSKPFTGEQLEILRSKVGTHPLFGMRDLNTQSGSCTVSKQLF